MKFFKNPIVKWLALAFSLFLAIIIFQGVFALREMGQIHKQTQKISQDHLPSIAAISSINTDASDFRIKQLRHNLAVRGEEEEMKQQEAEMAIELASIEKNQAKYEPLISSNQEERLYEDFQAKWREYLEIHETFLPLSRAFKNDEAAKLLRDATPLFRELSSDLDQLVALSQQGSVVAAEANEENYSETTRIVIAMILLGLLMGLITAFVFSKLIFQSVSRALWPVINQMIAAVGVLSSSSQQASAASVQNASIAQQVAAGASQQARQSEEVSKTVTQMAAATAQMSSSAQAASSASLNTAQIAQETGERAEKIEKVVDTITNIAEQTNLLSLNASIEAARAGEQGRGFAVVADEVKKLAEQSAASASEVKDIVREVTESIASTVTSIKNVSTKVEEVSTTAQQQAAAIHQIAKTMDSVAAVTEQNTAGAASLSAAAEQQSAANKQIVGVSENLQHLAESLAHLAGNGNHQTAPVATYTAEPTAHLPAPHHHTPLIQPEQSHQEFEAHLEKAQEHIPSANPTHIPIKELDEPHPATKPADPNSQDKPS